MSKHYSPENRKVRIKSHKLNLTIGLLISNRHGLSASHTQPHGRI